MTNPNHRHTYALITFTLAILTATTLWLTRTLTCPTTPPQTHPTPTINAGDHIYTTNPHTNCTVGWSNNHYALTAGHCIAHNTTIYNTANQHVGNAYRDPHRDLAIIPLTNNTPQQAPPTHIGHDVTLGTTLCMTTRTTNTHTCGHITHIDGDHLRVEPTLRGAPGDSGAGVASSEGFVGVYTGVVKSNSGVALFSTVERA